MAQEKGSRRRSPARRKSRPRRGPLVRGTRNRSERNEGQAPAGASAMKTRNLARRYVVCLRNEGYGASLVVRRIYQLVPDRQAEKRGLCRVVDESGEDYLYPKRLFAEVDLPLAVSRKLAVAT